MRKVYFEMKQFLKAIDRNIKENHFSQIVAHTKKNMETFQVKWHKSYI